MTSMSRDPSPAAHRGPSSDAGSGALRLSVVIPNYNYGQFVSAAVRSALAQDWPDVEVIVVDDGSTDDSRERIAEFGDAIVAILQDNAGAREAVNTGFARSTGDMVIFLDSDDQLEPGAARAIASVWRHGVSKVQFPMRRVDAGDVEIAPPFPALRSAPTPEQMRAWISRTGAYPTPPGSGNAYARSFLERVMPLDDSCGESSDSALVALAPFLGDVVTVLQPLARYRLHGANDSYLLADPARFTDQLRVAYQRHLYVLQTLGTPSDGARVLFRGRHLLQLRVAGARMRPDDHPIPGDSKARMLADVVSSPFAPGPEGIGYRVAVLCWCLATLAAPRPVAERLIRNRFRQGR